MFFGSARLLTNEELLGPKPCKTSGSHIDASHSRQPLVKGERLVRNEVNAVMLFNDPAELFNKISKLLTPLFHSRDQALTSMVLDML